ncbi:MAG: hypothetical protein K2W78_15770 [Xanthobacteraceae bacterium]|nr:hypothetical protein [Xanthobacteraceae bacterium]
MTTASHAPPHATETRGTPSPQPTDTTISKPHGRRKAATVSWYGALLIAATLSVVAGWEIFLWILAIITLD